MYAGVLGRRWVPSWSLFNASVRRQQLQPCHGQLRLLRQRSTAPSVRPSFPHHRRWDGVQDGSLSDQYVGTRWWFTSISGFATSWHLKPEKRLCVMATDEVARIGNSAGSEQVAQLCRETALQGGPVLAGWCVMAWVRQYSAPNVVSARKQKALIFYTINPLLYEKR